ncbi:MAG TPA: NACHT domain-containing protein [Verrucomicrobiae bacterium]|jgi:hypothetical protein
MNSKQTLHLSDLIAEGLKHFENQAKYDYIPLPAQLSNVSLRHDNVEAVSFIDPCHFLANSQAAFAGPQIRTPSVSLVAAEYGMGKTELMRRLTQRLECAKLPPPLVVNLAECRSNAGSMKALTESPFDYDKFIELLFGHLSPNRGEKLAREVDAELATQRTLIFDSLDEMASDEAQHRYFFAGLNRLLTDNARQTSRLIRVVVTVRWEYLLAFDKPGFEDLRQELHRDEDSLPIYLIRLSAFGSDDISSYIELRKLNWLDPLFRKDKDLLTMLRRPLLLRLFCDVAEKHPQAIKDDLERLQRPDQIISLYVKAATVDPHLVEAQNKITQASSNTLEIDHEKLATLCVRLFSQRRNDLNVNELRQILRKPAPDQRPESVWQHIHKYPFLKRNNDNAEFAHRSFLEYFVALGMSRAGDQDKLNQFDELVLNVDMRQFLRAMQGKTWFARTFRSYALDRPEEWKLDGAWPALDKNTEETLDQERTRLLDLMTDPMMQPPKDWNGAAAVFGFLERRRGSEKGKHLEKKWGHAGLHPRYLMYNYEAVAVFLKYHWWSEGMDPIKLKFPNLIEAGVEFVLDRLRCGKLPNLLDADELLLERMLDIAQRFAYSWAKRHGTRSGREIIAKALKRPANAPRNADNPIVKRIETILNGLARTT